VGITYEEITKSIDERCKKFGFAISEAVRGLDPYIMNPDSQVIRELSKIANEITGSNGTPSTISGTTYAHLLPNAYIYGMSGNLPPEDFPKGRGGAHGIDEVVSLDRLKRAMKIYARALLKLNEIDWI